MFCLLRRESLVKLDHLVSEESLERRWEPERNQNWSAVAMNEQSCVVVDRVLVESVERRERLDNLELLEKRE